MFDKVKQDWEDMPRFQKYAFGGFVALGLSLIAAHAAFRPSKPADQVASETAAEDRAEAPATPDAPSFHGRTALPESTRNQGLEDLTLKVDKVMAYMEQDMKNRAAQDVKAPSAGTMARPTATGTTATNSSSASVNLDEIIPTPTFTSDTTAGAKGGAPIKQPGSGGLFAFGGADAASAAEPAQARMKVWEDAPQSSDADVSEAKRDGDDEVAIPANAAIESVLLSGFNARPSGSTGGAVGGAQTSANNVGAPFVTRLKGDAILPNGWKVSDLGDCFLGGSAIAVLSTERAYAVANTLSCIKPNGEIYEGSVKAYALDVDGTLGLAGKVVSKQGSLLLQAALTGMVSGLGQALSPTSIPTYNSNGTNGSTQSYQYPNLGAVAATSVGGGIQQASAQLSKFYLQYASEVFPVVEVVSSTRATWVLQETVVLKRHKSTKEAQR
jgi:conjugal transfer pilus assembly protein TraB